MKTKCHLAGGGNWWRRDGSRHPAVASIAGGVGQRVSEEELMALRNCALVVGVCITLAMAAPPTYGQVPGRDLHPRQVLLVTDAVASVCKTIFDEVRNRMNPRLGDAELKTDEELEGEIRARFGELFRKMQSREPGWLAINLSGDAIESIIREAMYTRLDPLMKRDGCKALLDQFIVDKIYDRPRRR
jgi:hypothetical protein